MEPILIGVDVGGTHTDGVAIGRKSGRVIAKIKIPTTPLVHECATDALEGLVAKAGAENIARIVLSTTLMTNAVATNKFEPVGTLLMAGPGLNPYAFGEDPFTRVISGQMDHRGREIQPINPEEVRRHLDAFVLKGIQVVAVAGKFAVRNPAHEKAVAEMAEPHFDYVAASHRLSGALNFPRRAATAQLAAALWRLHDSFIDQMKRAAHTLGIDAPLYLLRADGGAQRCATFRNPAEAALSGPAASIMGIAATDALDGETVGLDIGGTTTDINIFVKDAPLLEPNGAKLGPHKTHIRSLYTRSVPLGGDGVVTVTDGVIGFGPRRGPASAWGGTSPTVTDALVLLGRAEGDEKAAAFAFAPLAEAMGLEVQAFAEKTAAAFAQAVAAAVAAHVEEVNAQPVYTLHELLDGHRVAPHRAAVVGGPAAALAEPLAKALGYPTFVPVHAEVTNACGAAVSAINLEVHGVADTAAGRMVIPERSVQKSVNRAFTMEQLHAACATALAELAAEANEDVADRATDIAQAESFRIVEGYGVVGEVHYLKLQLRSAILTRVEG